MTIQKLPFAFAVCTLLSACGGGGGASAPVTPAPVATPVVAPSLPLGTAGVFDVNYGQFTGVYTFLENGDFYGVHYINGGTLAGHPHGPLSAANSMNNMERISWANFVDDTLKVGAQEPSGTFGRTFGATSLSVKIVGSMGTFTAGATQQKGYGDNSGKTLYGDPLALSILAGNYHGFMRSVGINQIQQDASAAAIDAAGALSVTVADCTFKGTLNRHGATGIFNLQVQTSGIACKFGPTLKGIVTPLSYINGVVALALQLDSPDNSQTAVFIIAK